MVWIRECCRCGVRNGGVSVSVGGVGNGNEVGKSDGEGDSEEVCGLWR